MNKKLILWIKTILICIIPAFGLNLLSAVLINRYVPDCPSELMFIHGFAWGILGAILAERYYESHN